MDETELVTLSFIVRIWIDDPIEGLDARAWHGLITHVPDGARRYFQDLSAIPPFIAPYVEAQGGEVKRTP